jgi:hypothetical protein
MKSDNLFSLWQSVDDFLVLVEAPGTVMVASGSNNRSH